MMTAFLSRSDVSRHLQALHLLNELREAMRLGRQSTAHGFESGPTAVRQSTLEGIPAWVITTRMHSTAKPHSIFQLYAADSGQLLAVMEAGQVTTLCASLMSALAADVLAQPEAKNVAILGTGTSASSALKALRLVRSIERVWLYHPSVVDNFELAHRLQTSLSMAVHAASSAQEAVAQADIVVLTGEVALENVPLRAGAHVTVQRNDASSTLPIAREVLEPALRICESEISAASDGLPFDAQLGEIISGQKPGRQSNQEMTFFMSTGSAMFDVLAAWHVYQGARDDEGLTRINLES